MARLLPLAARFGETAPFAAVGRLQCLALLAHELTVAFRLKDELERLSADMNVANLKRWGRRADDLDADSRWRLETAHLGNLLRDGRCGEIERRLEPILADPSSFDLRRANLGSSVKTVDPLAAAWPPTMALDSQCWTRWSQVSGSASHSPPAAGWTCTRAIAPPPARKC